jgi:hypothetical protein
MPASKQRRRFDHFAPARKLLDIVNAKALVIPEEGWNAHTFARHGGPMILALARVAKITQRRAAPLVASTALRMFKSQLREVIERVLTNAHGHSTRAKAGIDIELPQHEALWARAIEDVFREARVEAVVELMPPIQSVMAQAYNRTSLILRQEPDPNVGAIVARNSRQIATRVANVSETTKRNISVAVRDAVENNLTVTDTAAYVEARVPQIFGNRSLTIARTELNRAWTQMSVASMQESLTMTHISVIGCEAREENSPQYRGESTCNIQDVPISDADSLEFHINHTGNIVPSMFRNPDGTFDPATARPTILEGED